MKQLFDSVVFEEATHGAPHMQASNKIAYEFLDSDGLRPYVRITFSIPGSTNEETEIELDIPQDDMVDLLNDVVDEWPEVVDCSPVRVKRGVQLIPTFC